MDKKDARSYFINDIIDAYRKSYSGDNYYRGEKYSTQEDLFVAIVEDAADSYEARLRDIRRDDIDIYSSLDFELQDQLDHMNFFDAKHWLNRYDNANKDGKKELEEELGKHNCINGEKISKAIANAGGKTYEMQVTNIREIDDDNYKGIIENIILGDTLVSKEDCDYVLKELYGEGMTKEKLDMIKKKKEEKAKEEFDWGRFFR
jgi:hypothetical protein